MGRLRGSKNKGNGDGEVVQLRNSISGADLRGYIERIEYCNEQQQEISFAGTPLGQAGADRVREEAREG
jgi:hypothetical protein